MRTRDRLVIAALEDMERALARFSWSGEWRQRLCSGQSFDERSDIRRNILGITARGRQIHPRVRGQNGKRNQFRCTSEFLSDRLKGRRVC
jgi:hypothetical protein